MKEITTIATGTGAREIVATRIFNALRDLVFRVWTDPRHIAAWWGPKALTPTVDKMDVKPGGVWRFVQRDPEGLR